MQTQTSWAFEKKPQLKVFQLIWMKKNNYLPPKKTNSPIFLGGFYPSWQKRRSLKRWRSSESFSRWNQKRHVPRNGELCADLSCVFFGGKIPTFVFDEIWEFSFKSFEIIQNSWRVAQVCVDVIRNNTYVYVESEHIYLEMNCGYQTGCGIGIPTKIQTKWRPGSFLWISELTGCL